VHYC